MEVSPESAHGWLARRSAEVADQYADLVSEAGMTTATARVKPLFLKRAVGVIRVSKVGDREGDSFVSPTEQRERIEKFCLSENLRLLDVFEEMNISGFSRKSVSRRPGLRPAIEMVEAGDADVVIVAYFDRFFRNGQVKREAMGRVKDAGGSMVAIDFGELSEETAPQWLNLEVMMLMAEYQARATRDRTAGPKERAVANGIPPFPRIPVGYRRGDDRRLVPHETEAPLVRQAYELREEGASIAEIRQWLRDQGVEIGWRATQEMLKWRGYLGELHFGKLSNLHAHKPIIDPATFKSVQSMRVSRERREKSVRLLARQNLLFCAHCGGRMVVGGQNRRDRFGQTVRYVDYRCNPLSDCPERPSIMAHAVEKYVADYVKMLQRAGQASVSGNVLQAEAEAEQAEQALNNAVRAFDGLGNVAAARERLLGMQAEAEAAREHAVSLRAASGVASSVSASGDWDTRSLHQQRALLRVLIGRITVRRGRAPVDERVTVERLS